MITECQSILVDRAVFGSSNQGAIQGYQLVSWSSGIDAEISKELCQWAPTRLHRTDTEDFRLPWLAMAFPIGANRMAIGRTCVAVQEYSGRGGANIVTTFIILDASQWQAYNFDALGVLQFAMALGHVRLAPGPTNGNLSRLQLPATLPLSSATFFGFRNRPSQGDSLPDLALLDQWAKEVEHGKRLILVGLNNTLGVMAELTQRLSGAARQRFSFSTGLPLSVHRPFQVHCLDESAYRHQIALVGWLADTVYQQ